ncbi:MAG: GlxA family transcriptional regulator [Novosphingobium sp.]|nr:GlxA family transcriptional regulator [Novosphingobium sp.]
MPDSATPAYAARLAFLLTDGFSLMSYASVLEPFRAANELAGRNLYDWTHLSVDGGPVTASNGASLVAAAPSATVAAFDRIFVLAAGDPSRFRDERCLGWMRRMAHAGSTLIGVSGGPYLLARAGLLHGRRATIHWEHAPALRDEFPDIELESGLYVIDGNRMTCAGGTAGMDLAVALIALDHGDDLARKVAEWFISAGQRDPGAAQRPAPIDRHRTRDTRLLRMLAAMEGAIEEPLARKAIATRAGLSLRHLERLCASEMASSVAEIYLGIRLDRAAELLRSTRVDVTDVSLACGFRSASHFSRRFSKRFGFPPSRRRP